MDTVYITGHRNPDTDSIVSAMAYAALKNALGQREYKAARLGQISDETQIVLNRFGFEPPQRYTEPCLADHGGGPHLRFAGSQ